MLTLALLVVFISFFGTLLFLSLNSDMTLSTSPYPFQEDVSESKNEESIVWFSIFSHNFIILLPALIGVLSLGFLSILYVSLQGYLLGVTIYSFSQTMPISTLITFTIFHGGFEMIAIALITAFAIKPGDITIQSIRGKRTFIQRTDLKDMAVLIMLYVVFLLIAAVIEGIILVNL
ncbi:stage II sporulation protein M [Bacillus sp. V3B]|uniref:stage II sporulation protein M n=1 Tax=Bacillus sp. V3B TaxID=2804915 RepID=UPI00210BBBD9|nr:stage II sporulation protein M [Bacillus sp. V3B]MCQ6277180.1 stage II sporulation protein M [Bacillus sp. V3B]